MPFSPFCYVPPPTTRNKRLPQTRRRNPRCHPPPTTQSTSTLSSAQKMARPSPICSSTVSLRSTTSHPPPWLLVPSRHRTRSADLGHHRARRCQRRLPHAHFLAHANRKIPARRRRPSRVSRGPVIFFTDQGMQNVANYSTDGNALSATLDSENIGLRFINLSAGSTAPPTAWVFRLTRCANWPRALCRTRVVTLSCGRHPAGRFFPDRKCSSATKKRIRSSLNTVNFSNLFRAARMTLYAVNPLGSSESMFRGTYYEEFVKGVEQAEPGRPRKRRVTSSGVQSSGEVLDFNNDMSARLAKFHFGLRAVLRNLFRSAAGRASQRISSN